MRSPSCLCPLTLLGNGSVTTFQRQRIHVQRYKNSWTRRSLGGPFRIKYAVCSERKVGD
jgi:hypothetical protein